MLSIFRQIEIRLPSQVYVHHHIAFEREHAMAEADLRKLLADQGFMVVFVSYRLTNDGNWFEYRTILRTLDGQNTARLADVLCHMPQVRDFRIAPAND